MKRVLWAIAISAPLVAVLAYGFGRNATTIKSPLVGKPASGFALKSIDGRTLSLGSLRGKPVILNFWASWCVDCRVEHPSLTAAWRKYGQRVQIVGVAYQDAPADAGRFMRRWGGGWPVLRDPDGSTAIDYGVYGVPETFFIDRDGVVRYKSIGPVTWDQLQTRIESLLRRTA